ncbi:DNA primase large subunit PriL [Thermococcus atlanticus]
MLDPFGPAAKELVKEIGGINELLMRIPGYVGIDEVMERVTWLKNGELPSEFLGLGDLEDLMGFYALLGALAFSPYGLEMEVVREANARIYSERISKYGAGSDELGLPLMKVNDEEIPERDRVIVEKRLHSEISPEEREKLRLKYRMHIGDILRLWEGSLKDIYIKNGYGYLTEGQMLRLWKKSFEKNIERAVGILYEIRDELPQYYLQLYERLGEFARDYFKERLERFGSAKAQPLRFDLFPPCIKAAMRGVPSGLRNYAITVLLTSFLSYARICPNPPRKDIRVKDCIKDLSVIEKEILPVIIEAGNRCVPPLFEDQPNEVKNIWYHLGFGFTERPNIEDSGNTPWYFPPNCDKIRTSAPQLCRPDRDCRNIKNPLTYYLRKLYFEGKRSGEKNE